MHPNNDNKLSSTTNTTKQLRQSRHHHHRNHQEPQPSPQTRHRRPRYQRNNHLRSLNRTHRRHAERRRNSKYLLPGRHPVPHHDIRTRWSDRSPQCPRRGHDGTVLDRDGGVRSQRPEAHDERDAAFEADDADRFAGADSCVCYHVSVETPFGAEEDSGAGDSDPVLAGGQSEFCGFDLAAC